ncbi:17309_t:CDS:2, partial [Rhizophagus irregularis]
RASSVILPFRIWLKQLRTFPLLCFSKEHLPRTGFQFEELYRLPVEIVEHIVAKIPDTDLIAASKVDTVGKQYEKDNIDWITFESEWNGCRPQERETIEYVLSEQRWGGDLWGLNWEWNEWTQQE